MKSFILDVKPEIYSHINSFAPAQSLESITQKVDEFVVELTKQICNAKFNEPTRSNKLGLFNINTTKLRPLLGQTKVKINNKKSTKWVYDLVRDSSNPLFIEDNRLNSVGKTGSIKTYRLSDFFVLTKRSHTELLDAITYKEPVMPELSFDDLYIEEEINEDFDPAYFTKLNAYNRHHKTNELVESLYPDYDTNNEEYELIRMNHASMRTYYHWLLTASGMTSDRLKRHAEIIPILLAVGEYFAAKHPERNTYGNSDFTEFGWLPVKKSPSKFGRVYYKSPARMFDPQSMDRDLRKVVLGTQHTYDYDMQAFAITWYFGVVNGIIPTANRIFPLTHAIVCGERKGIFNRIAYDVFGDRITSMDDLKAEFETSEHKLYFKDGILIDNSVINNGKPHPIMMLTEEAAHKILKGAFQSITFGADFNMITYKSSSRLDKKTGKMKDTYRSTAILDIFKGCRDLVRKFYANVDAIQFKSEMDQMIGVIMDAKYTDYAHLIDDEDFHAKGGEWKPTKVMPFLYQHAEWEIMERVRELLTTEDPDVLLVANIHDGMVLSRHTTAIGYIQDVIRKEFSNPYLTFTGEKYKGYKTKHFVQQAEMTHTKWMEIENRKVAEALANGYKSPFIAEKSEAEIEAERIEEENANLVSMMNGLLDSDTIFTPAYDPTEFEAIHEEEDPETITLKGRVITDDDRTTAFAKLTKKSVDTIELPDYNTSTAEDRAAAIMAKIKSKGENVCTSH